MLLSAEAVWKGKGGNLSLYVTMMLSMRISVWRCLLADDSLTDQMFAGKKRMSGHYRQVFMDIAMAAISHSYGTVVHFNKHCRKSWLTLLALLQAFSDRSFAGWGSGNMLVLRGDLVANYCLRHVQCKCQFRHTYRIELVLQQRSSA